MEQEFIGQIPKQYLEEIQITAQSPSNIALVKYWGKKQNQIPQNPSLSFTLKNCRTQTKLIAHKIKAGEKITFEVFFDGVLKNNFNEKIDLFFERIVPYLPFLNSYHFQIHTENSFPHSSGIASSASGMAALSMALVRLEQRLFPKITTAQCLKKASFLARLGSGSACRSITGDCVLWGRHTAIEKSADTYGVPIKNMPPVFKTYQDSILLVDKGQKQVSSSLGHSLMQGNVYATERFKQAYKNIDSILNILKRGDVENFVKLVESEALTLHAMMMSSNPYFILMKPQTLEIINRIWKFRKEQNIPVCFTLDAGANVHVLYPKEFSQQVKLFISSDLKCFCENEQVLHDEVGQGSRWI